MLYVNRRTGFVPVKLKVRVRGYKAGEVVGFMPKEAQALINEGVAEAFHPSDLSDFETQQEVKVEKPVEDKKTSVTSTDFFDGDVDIPDDWETMHHLKKVALAKRIAKVVQLDAPPGVKPADFATEIIRKELENRSKAEKAAAE